MPWIWVVVMAPLIVQRPVCARDVWWHLARGREVLSGSPTPSRDLLLLDTAAEPDWLGGVPLYLLWLAGGVLLLGVVPVLSAFGISAWFMRRSPAPQRGILVAVLLPLWLLLARPHLQPTSDLFDLLGMAAVWRLLQFMLRTPNHLVWMALLFCVWANTGAQPVWGLLLVGLHSGRTVPTMRMLVAAAAGGMLTPRGILTWRDALVLFAPGAFTDLGAWADPGWGGVLPDHRWGGAEVGLLALWVIAVAAGRPRTIDLNQVARWLVPLVAAGICRRHIPECGLWLLLDWLQPGFTRSQHSNDSATAIAPRPRYARWATAACGAAVLCITVADAGGWGLAPFSRLGWGMSHAVDIRLLDGLLQPEHGTGHVWAGDRRSAGAAAWTGQASLLDHPQRALLGGRWPLHAGFMADLAGAHRARYRRADGSWGGSYAQAREWEVDVLYVPMEMGAIHGSFRETAWRPVDLDSPVVPYVSGEDLRFAESIVAVLGQEQLVETGHWQPTADVYDGGDWRADWIELAGGGPDPDPAVRQAAFFRSRGLTIAALRSLLPVRKLSDGPQLRREFAACQSAAAHEEWVLFGQCSQFRKRAALAVWKENLDPPWRSPVAFTTDSGESATVDPWQPSIEAYLSGQVDEAVKLLPQSGPEREYAAGMLCLELGEVDRAREHFQECARSTEPDVIIQGAKYWLDQLTSSPSG